ncbi:hypothetical protein [Enterovirga rhinocerotis]|uniref:Uncharacterized protein n=1 Tax=Enterovirga rhinocerotis TaxID=1339210 RepID=A0A4R7CAC2_9HYPH|nr:hypothetical protein [Enterovirga rhinocerotis]TDR93936.1 hypothetical protein EV668_1205 [Enterovirga rhinocerotis]
MSSPAKTTVLVANTYQARKVRWFFWACVPLFIGCAYWGWDLSRTYGLSPGDGGVLQPLSWRLTVAAIVVAVGLLPLAGMILYVRRYVAGLIRQGGEVIVTFVGWPAPSERRIPVAQVTPGREHDGRFSTLTHRVNTPWMTIRLAGRIYLIDLQAELVDRHALSRLFTEARRQRERRS